MGRPANKAREAARGGEMQACLPETLAAQGLTAAAGAENSADDLAVSEALVSVDDGPDQDAEPIGWGAFRDFVMKHGKSYVRAGYPNPPEDLINTIWCGVPVLDRPEPSVMTPRGEWEPVLP